MGDTYTLITSVTVAMAPIRFVFKFLPGDLKN